MGGCSAPNCSNHSRKGFRLFRFPRNEERRKKWLINSRRNHWIPGTGAYLCEAHFEESQFESLCKDEKKKLRKNAIPTIFYVPSPPPVLSYKRKKGIRNPKSGSALEKIKREKDSSTEDYKEVEELEDEREQQIELLKRENESMKQEISEFEKHNKAMERVILELEKHNKLMNTELIELDKNNKVLTNKVSDLESVNEDLKSKLNCCFTEEQTTRMDKMRQLGTILRYIPALK